MENTRRLSADVIQHQIRILRLSKQASNVLSELHELTGFEFTEAYKELTLIDELAPMTTQVMPRTRTEMEAF